MGKVAIQFTSTHQLDFEIAPWEFGDEFVRFRVGTCEGLYGKTKEAFCILAITNNSPGNGHVEDVMQWFEHSCKRDKVNLMFLEVWNKRFKERLLKNGFNIVEGTDHVIKKITL